MRASDLRAKVERLKGGRQELLGRQTKLKADQQNLAIYGRKLEEAQTIIRTVALQTQQELQYHVSSITTAALEAVFPDPYQFVVEFVERRGRTEADVFFMRDGERVDPITGSGGGAVDVAAFSLRASMWRLQTPPSRAVLILDEPFRFLSKDLQPKAAEMLKEISVKLGLQIIMVTHNEDLVEAADRLFLVSQRKGISKVITKEEQVEERRRKGPAPICFGDALAAIATNNMDLAIAKKRTALAPRKRTRAN